MNFKKLYYNTFGSLFNKKPEIQTIDDPPKRGTIMVYAGRRYKVTRVKNRKEGRFMIKLVEDHS